MKSYSILLVAGILLLLVPRVHASWFTDTQQCQGALNEQTSSSAWGDYDNDGDQELFVGTGNSTGCHLWKKTANGFEDKAIDLGIGFHGVVAASCWGDFDNDGLLDLFIANGSGDDGCYLYRNLGAEQDYSFERVVHEPPDPDLPFNNIIAQAKGTVWGDFNNDGILDLFVAFSHYQGGGSHYFLYLGNGSDFYAAWDIGEDRTPLDVTATDMDGDGDLDVFVVVDSDPCRLFRNLYDPENPWTIDFEDQAFFSGVNLTDATSASFADYNYDGRPDLFITGNDEHVGSHLFRNDGSDEARIIFTDVTSLEFNFVPPIAGNASAWGDFDLDGDQDLYISANGTDWLYKNMHREGFSYFSAVDRIFSGLGDDALSLCAAWADFNNDGKPDIFMGNLISEESQEYFDKLYENDYSEAPQNRYLSIKLIGAHCGIVPFETFETNKSGIGGKVRLSYRLNGVRTCQWGEVSGGGTGSHSQGSLPLEFGVGTAETIDSVLVYWPSGDTSIFEYVATNKQITILEHGIYAGVGAYLVLDYRIHGNYYFSGDIQVSIVKGEPGGLTVLSGTRVFGHKTFRTNLPPKIYIPGGHFFLRTYGSEGLPAIFTSQ